MTKSFYYMFAGLFALTATAVSNKAAAQTLPVTETPSRDTLLNVSPLERISNGYLSIQKRDIPGSVATVKESRIKEMAGFSIDALLQGQAAGMRVINTSGAPGSGALTIIRGASTLNAGTLYCRWSAC
jgi:TonB-dependent starch-binding outer membrane protein SusC